MITLKASKHDDYSVEFKLGFYGDYHSATYSVNTWIFVPNSLDIDPETYGKDQFYRDIKTNVRLITPVFTLAQMAQPNALPIQLLREAFSQMEANPSKEATETYAYRIKMFAAIYKSALRDYTKHLLSTQNALEKEAQALRLCELLPQILKPFRALPPAAPFHLANEYLSRQTDYRLGRLLRHGGFPEDSTAYRELTALLESEMQHKKQMGYQTFTATNATQNAHLLYRYGLLKKFAESELYIKLKKREDGFAVKQIYYSLAAGLAMIFATAIAWAFQLRYGNITMPLFVALVVSYMLKDRIKELMRLLFAHKRLNRFFDHKAQIHIANHHIGHIKEGVDFVSQSHTPAYVRQLRMEHATVPNEDLILEERVLLYRNQVRLDHEQLHQSASFPVEGIHQILRLHVNRFIQKMDNPSVPVALPSGAPDHPALTAQKYYKMHIVMQWYENRSPKKVTYHPLCLTLTRNGILQID